MLPPCLFVVHDTVGGGEDKVPEVARRQHIVDPFLNVRKRNIKARRDDAALVDAAVELNNDFARAMIVDYLELANVAWGWGEGKELTREMCTILLSKTRECA